MGYFTPALLLGLVLILRGGRECLAAHDPNFCVQTQPAGVSLPRAPETYSVSMVLGNGTNQWGALEYYDGRIQKSSFQVYARDSPYRAIVSFITNQVQVINLNRSTSLLDTCKVQNVSSPDILVPVTLGERLFILPSKLFFGGGSINIAPMTQETLPNGEAVNTYSSCYYWAGQDMSLKLKWHFRQRTPNTPYRVVVEGKDNTNQVTFTNTYNIAIFQASLPIWQARYNPFMAPPGLYCRGLSSYGRKVQTVPDRFSMRIERIPLGSTTATYMREAYDFKANMSLLLGYPPETSGDKARYGEGMLLYIHDFARRLSYIRNEDMGNCTYERLTNSDWDSQKDGNQLRIRTPREFFDLDTSFIQYKGTGLTREITTDIFISYKEVNIGDDIPLMVGMTVEWYFANRTVTDLETKQPVIQAVPLSALVTSDATWLNAWMYIYDFDSKDQIFNRHDIAACFSNDDKKHFQFYFPQDRDNVIKYIRGNPNEFTRLLIPIIALGLNVSPLRVLDPEVTVRDKSIVMELTITEKPKFQTDAEETPLKEIEAALNLLLKANSLVTMIEVNGEEVLMTANRVTVVEERTSNLKSIGYSAGAVAGAAIGLLLAGLLAGLIAAFLYWR